MSGSGTSPGFTSTMPACILPNEDLLLQLAPETTVIVSHAGVVRPLSLPWTSLPLAYSCLYPFLLGLVENRVEIHSMDPGAHPSAKFYHIPFPFTTSSDLPIVASTAGIVLLATKTDIYTIRAEIHEYIRALPPDPTGSDPEKPQPSALALSWPSLAKFVDPIAVDLTSDPSVYQLPPNNITFDCQQRAQHTESPTIPRYFDSKSADTYTLACLEFFIKNWIVVHHPFDNFMATLPIDPAVLPRFFYDSLSSSVSSSGSIHMERSSGSFRSTIDIDAPLSLANPDGYANPGFFDSDFASHGRSSASLQLPPSVPNDLKASETLDQSDILEMHPNFLMLASPNYSYTSAAVTYNHDQLSRAPRFDTFEVGSDAQFSLMFEFVRAISLPPSDRNIYFSVVVFHTVKKLPVTERFYFDLLDEAPPASPLQTEPLSVFTRVRSLIATLSERSPNMVLLLRVERAICPASEGDDSRRPGSRLSDSGRLQPVQDSGKSYNQRFQGDAASAARDMSLLIRDEHGLPIVRMEDLREPVAFAVCRIFDEEGAFLLSGRGNLLGPLYQLRSGLTDSELCSSLDSIELLRPARFGGNDSGLVMNGYFFRPFEFPSGRMRLDPFLNPVKTTSFFTVHLADEDPEISNQPVPPIVRGLLELPPFGTAVATGQSLRPPNSYVNTIFVYPHIANFRKHPLLTNRHLAGGIVMRVDVRDDEFDTQPPLCRYGRSSEPSFTPNAFTTVISNRRTLTFSDEIKLELPPSLQLSHHLFFTFYAIVEDAPTESSAASAAFSLFKRVANISNAPPPMPHPPTAPPARPYSGVPMGGGQPIVPPPRPGQPPPPPRKQLVYLGFSCMRVFSSLGIANGTHSLPICTQAPFPGYLALSTGMMIEDSKRALFLEDGARLFDLRIEVFSSVYTPDPPISRLCWALRHLPPLSAFLDNLNNPERSAEIEGRNQLWLQQRRPKATQVDPVSGELGISQATTMYLTALPILQQALEGLSATKGPIIVQRLPIILDICVDMLSVDLPSALPFLAFTGMVQVLNVVAREVAHHEAQASRHATQARSDSESLSDSPELLLHSYVKYAFDRVNINSVFIFERLTSLLLDILEKRGRGVPLVGVAYKDVFDHLWFFLALITKSMQLRLSCERLAREEAETDSTEPAEPPTAEIFSWEFVCQIKRMLQLFIPIIIEAAATEARQQDAASESGSRRPSAEIWSSGRPSTDFNGSGRSSPMVPRGSNHGAPGSEPPQFGSSSLLPVVASPRPSMGGFEPRRISTGGFEPRRTSTGGFEPARLGPGMAAFDAVLDGDRRTQNHRDAHSGAPAAPPLSLSQRLNQELSFFLRDMLPTLTRSQSLELVLTYLQALTPLHNHRLAFIEILMDSSYYVHMNGPFDIPKLPATARALRTFLWAEEPQAESAVLAAMAQVSSTPVPASAARSFSPLQSFDSALAAASIIPLSPRRSDSIAATVPAEVHTPVRPQSPPRPTGVTPASAPLSPSGEATDSSLLASAVRRQSFRRRHTEPGVRPAPPIPGRTPSVDKGSIPKAGGTPVVVSRAAALPQAPGLPSGISVLDDPIPASQSHSKAPAPAEPEKVASTTPQPNAGAKTDANAGFSAFGDFRTEGAQQNFHVFSAILMETTQNALNDAFRLANGSVSAAEVTAAEALQLKAFRIVRQVLEKHEHNIQYQHPLWKQTVAVFHLPLLTLLLDFCSQSDLHRAVVANTTDLLVSSLFIIKHCLLSDAMSSWWKRELALNTGRVREFFFFLGLLATAFAQPTTVSAPAQEEPSDLPGADAFDIVTEGPSEDHQLTTDSIHHSRATTPGEILPLSAHPAGTSSSATPASGTLATVQLQINGSAAGVPAQGAPAPNAGPTEPMQSRFGQPVAQNPVSMHLQQAFAVEVALVISNTVVTFVRSCKVDLQMRRRPEAPPTDKLAIHELLDSVLSVILLILRMDPCDLVLTRICVAILHYVRLQGGYLFSGRSAQQRDAEQILFELFRHGNSRNSAVRGRATGLLQVIAEENYLSTGNMKATLDAAVSGFLRLAILRSIKDFTRLDGSLRSGLKIFKQKSRSPAPTPSGRAVTSPAAPLSQSVAAALPRVAAPTTEGQAAPLAYPERRADLFDDSPESGSSPAAAVAAPAPTSVAQPQLLSPQKLSPTSAEAIANLSVVFAVLIHVVGQVSDLIKRASQAADLSAASELYYTFALKIQESSPGTDLSFLPEAAMDVHDELLRPTLPKEVDKQSLLRANTKASASKDETVPFIALGFRLTLHDYRLTNQQHMPTVPESGLLDGDFLDTKRFYRLLPNGTKVAFKNYAPRVCRAVRESCGYNENQYLLSLSSDSSINEWKNAGGKSGAPIYSSKNGNFILKAITKPEMAVLRQMLPDYYKHISAHPSSLLTRFLGLHSFKVHPHKRVYIIVMENLMKTEKKLDQRFDLKGSKVGRYEKEQEKPSTLKDLNLKENIHLGPEQREVFVAQLRADCEFLRKFGIMDFSLLVGVHNGPPTPPVVTPSGILGIVSGTQYESVSETVGTYTRVGVTKPLGTPALPPLPPSVFRLHNGGCQGKDQTNTPIQRIYFFGIVDILQQYTLKKTT
eukprot:TRINITY_DN4702_c0_g1_i1.p1 TRINITY_DN4702_c0_g1~~TRINITY_DN4702_c0_g1_i1.p1  ORF type:complete len:2891 (+),score=507.22 TRINITY_DN4702_c0_g1_i1:932-8674(+)